MALSLLCKDCDTLFRNMKEAQAHNEATGHANFEESTKPVSVPGGLIIRPDSHI